MSYFRTSSSTARRRATVRVAAATASAVLALGLAACGEDSAGSGDDQPAAAAATAVSVEEGWVKATEEDMTGVFGQVHNESDSELHLVAVHSDLTERAELHEMVPGGSGMQMQEKAGGFRIAAGETLELAPGGNHIMLMELGEPIAPGQQVELTLEFGDGSESAVTFDARAFAGGEEEYMGGGHGDHGEGEGGASHDG